MDETMLNKIIQEEIVHYDGELLALIYDLNPSLLSEKIRGNTSIKIPFFTVTDEISHKIGEGYKLRVTTHFQMKKDLVHRENLLKAKNDSLKAMGGKDTIRYHLISILDDVDIIVSNIKSRIRPISGTVLNEVADDLEFIANFMRRYQQNTTYLPEDFETIVAISRNFNDVASNFGESMDVNSKFKNLQRVVAIVDVISDTNTSINNLRITYTYAAKIAHPQNHKTFEKLSSPADKILDIGYYKFWAINPTTKLTMTDTIGADVLSDTIRISLKSIN